MNCVRDHSDNFAVFLVIIIIGFTTVYCNIEHTGLNGILSDNNFPSTVC